MLVRLHKNARTQSRHPRLSCAIVPRPKRKLAAQYGLSRSTVRKWKNREDISDRSHRPRILHTTLTPAQEAIVVELRRTLLLPLDDLQGTPESSSTQKPHARACGYLRRHGVSNLKALMTEEDTPKQTKTFKDYEPGITHIDVKYLPQMLDEPKRRYLFVAIDRATR